MVGKRKKVGPLWTILRRYIDLEGPTPVLHHMYLGSTQRDAELDHHADSSESQQQR